MASLIASRGLGRVGTTRQLVPSRGLGRYVTSPIVVIPDLDEVERLISRGDPVRSLRDADIDRLIADIEAELRKVRPATEERIVSSVDIERTIRRSDPLRGISEIDDRDIDPRV